MKPILFLLLVVAMPSHAQSKFFSTPSRGGAEGAKQNAQIMTFQNAFQRMNACTAQGRVYAPTNANKDANDCIAAFTINAATGDTTTTGRGNFNNGVTLSNGLTIASGGASITGNSDITGNTTITGTVGIGTTTPAYRLDVDGDIVASSWVRTCGPTGWYSETYGGGWVMQDATWIRSYNGKPVYMAAGFDTGTAAGVGCTGGMGAGYMLRVCGTTFVNGNTYTMGDMYVGGTGHGGSGNALFGSNGDVWMPFRGQWLSAALSDHRIKENVKDMAHEKGLKTIMKLKPVTFDWRDVDRAERYGTQIGFVAQEVEKLYPSIIDTGVTPFKIKTPKGEEAVENVKSIRYEMLVVPLVQSVQELKSSSDDQAVRFDELRATVEAQEREIKALRADMMRSERIQDAK